MPATGVCLLEVLVENEKSVDIIKDLELMNSLKEVRWGD